jgi:hemerythrin-like metal-binding protein
MEIYWNDSFATHIVSIDNDHKLVLTYMDELYHAISQGNDFSELTIIIKKLIDYSNVHFDREEVLMSKHLYPLLKTHQIMHREYKKEIDNFIEMAYQKDTKTMIKLLSFLKDWFINHIQVEDRKYVDFFQRNGIIEN